jgi:excinuclease ABC subunit A
MNILIVGAGAIGAFYGSALAKQGARISVVCRSDYDVVSREGYDIRSPLLGDHRFRPERVYREVAECREPPDYHGNFSSAKRFVLHTFATTQSATIKKRVAQYMVSTECPVCDGRRLRRESLSVKFAGLDIAEMSRLPIARVAQILRPYANADAAALRKLGIDHPEKALVAQRIGEDLIARMTVLLNLGLGYLSLERSTPTLSPGELQRRAA